MSVVPFRKLAIYDWFYSGGKIYLKVYNCSDEGGGYGHCHDEKLRPLYRLPVGNDYDPVVEYFSNQRPVLELEIRHSPLRDKSPPSIPHLLTILTAIAGRALMDVEDMKKLPADHDTNYCRKVYPGKPSNWCYPCLAQAAFLAYLELPTDYNWQQDMIDFMTGAGQVIGDTPRLMDDATTQLRSKLIREECHELLGVLNDPEHTDVNDMAGELADLLYVTIGTAVSAGIDLRPVWRAVHEANMRKLGGPRREDGKLLKDPNWEPANLAAVLVHQPPLQDVFQVIPLPVVNTSTKEASS